MISPQPAEMISIASCPSIKAEYFKAHYSQKTKKYNRQKQRIRHNCSSYFQVSRPNSHE